MLKLRLLTIVLFATSALFAQDFNTDEQYKQAMINAKQAFEAQQYSQAVLFYREALKIKPDELLPKYKVEDIRTIYIENQLDTMQLEVAPLAETKKVNRKERKKQEEEQLAMEKQAELVATQKMNQEADKATEELNELKLSSESIQIDEEPEIIDSSIVDEIISNREFALNELNRKNEEVIEQDKVEPSLTIKKRKVPDSLLHQDKELPIEQPEEKVVPEKKPVVKSPVPVQQKTSEPKKVDLKKMTTEERESWIKEETKKLALAYPNKKTVEEIQKPNKHITRVIMHIDGNIDVYLKVKHNWGATYYFIDELGMELRSINQQYFNLKTNLETYGH